MVLFIAWAWVRSIGHSDGLATHRWVFSNTQSMLHIEVNRIPLWKKWPPQISHGAIHPQYRTTAFPKPAIQPVSAPVTQMYLMIPHWLILLCVATPWCGLLLFLRWHRGRASAAAAIYETSPSA